MQFALYDGPGVSSLSQNCIKKLFESFNIKIELITAPLTKLHQYHGLIIPGGADLPYIDALGSQGMHTIKQFIQHGGVYLGICAGAYFGSQDIDFQPNIKGERLNLLSVKAHGPKYKPYIHNSRIGARAADQYFDNSKCTLYVNGGGWFEHHDPQLNFSYYDDQTPSCVIGQNKKGLVILSMPHFEISSQDLLDHEEEALSNNVISLLNQNTILKTQFIHSIIDKIYHFIHSNIV